MPNRDVLKKVLSSMHGEADYLFFFENLSSPDWLKPLEEEGMFSDPPQPVTEGRGTRFPFWAPSTYLVKIAGDAPNEVLKVIFSVRETSNPRVHESFVDAALNMPPEVAAKLVPKIVVWLDNPFRFLISKKSVDLVIHLLKGNEPNAAMELAAKLFSVRNEAGKAIPHFVNEWDFEKSLEKVMPHFRGKAALGLIDILSSSLEEAVKIEDRRDKEKFLDHSQYWRGSIEDSSQNRHNELKNTLVDHIRDLSEATIANHPEFAGSIYDRLVRNDLPITTRIAIHLVREKKESFKDKIPSLILSKKLLDSSDVWHEYSLLLRSDFASLKKEEQTLFWKNIDEANANREGDSKERELYPYYYILEPFLAKEQAATLSRFKEKYGEIAHPFYSFYSEGGMSSGPSSPFDLNELKQLNNKDLVKKISDWKPSGEWMSPSIEGLGRILQSLIAAEPQRLASDVELFKLTERTFVRSIIQGISEAAQSLPIDWPSTLKYLDWAIRNFDKPEEKNTSDDDRDSTWSWTRSAACRLLDQGFRLKSHPIPIQLRKNVWEIIDSALNDSDPDLARESDSASKKYYEIAINSTRGQAFECAIEYGLWILRVEDKKSGSKEIYPELLGRLDFHLNLENEKSLSIHSLYGRWLPWLFLIDNEWTTSNLSKIFPTDNKLKEYRDVAWNTYVVFNPPYKNVFRALLEEYTRQVELLDSFDEEDEDKPSSRFVEHIIILYLVSELDLDSSLFTSTMSKLGKKQKSAVIFQLSKELSDKEGDAPKKIVARAMAYWESRVEQCSKLSTPEEREELANFGWWMRSKSIDNEWVLHQAKAVIEFCHHIKPDHFVIDRLRSTAEEFPKETSEILSLLVDYKVGDHGYMGWLDEAKDILRFTLKNKTTSQEAKSTIDKLGALGFREFGELLKETSSK